MTHFRNMANLISLHSFASPSPQIEQVSRLLYASELNTYTLRNFTYDVAPADNHDPYTPNKKLISFFIICLDNTSKVISWFDQIEFIGFRSASNSTTCPPSTGTSEKVFLNQPNIFFVGPRRTIFLLQTWDWGSLRPCWKLKRQRIRKEIWCQQKISTSVVSIKTAP